MPKAKIIYPVRDLTEITASLLKVAHRSPYDPKEGRHNFIDQSLVKLDMTINDENRCRMVLSDRGVLGQCLLSVSKALKNGYRDRFLFVEYGELVKSPQDQLDKIYDFIDEPHYKHNFKNISYKQRERDQEVFKVADLHKIHSSLTPSSIDPKSILPPQVYKDLQGKEMWRV
jgi:sulfotransferase